MTSGSPSAIFLSVAPCEGRSGEWLPRRFPGKRLRDLFPIISGGKLYYKLLRSRIRFYFIWDRSRIIYEGPEPNYYFWGSGAELLFLRIRSRILILYYCNNNSFIIIFIFRVQSRIFRIRRCIITLLVIISLVFLRIRSRIIIYQK